MLSQKLRFPVSFLEEGTIINIKYPYEDKGKSKVRPAVIIYTGEKIVTALSLKITCKEKYKNLPYTVTLDDWKKEGLDRPSYVLSDKELVIHFSDQCEIRGRLSEDDLFDVKTQHAKAVMDLKTIRLSYDGGV